MKRLFYLSFLILCLRPLSATAQDTKEMTVFDITSEMIMDDPEVGNGDRIKDSQKIEYMIIKTTSKCGTKKDIDGNDNWVYHGNLYYLKSDGSVSSKEVYVDGKKNGLQEEYQNGKLKRTVMFKNGDKNGAMKFYDKNGKVKATYYYKDGDEIK